MVFTPNTVARNQGRRGHFGIAAQVEPDLYVPPTNFLRETGGTGWLPDDLDRMSQAFRGNSFENPADYAGTDYLSRSVTTEATIADLLLLVPLLYGAPGAGGVITPTDATQWADYFPNPAFSAQWHVPGAGHVQVTNGQLQELNLTVPEQRTEFVTAALTFHGGVAVRHPEGAPLNGFVPVVPVVPGYAGGLGRFEHTFTLGGTAYIPDSTSTARLFNPVAPLPATGPTGTLFAPADDPIGAEFAMTFARPVSAILELGKSKAFSTLVWKLQVSATKLLEITAAVQVTARTIDVAPGRVRMPVTFRARNQTPGVAPFTVTVKNT